MERSQHMSSAFRNFILTLVLMLVILGVAAWKLVPMLENAVLKPIFSETSDSSTVSEPEVSDYSDEPVSNEVSGSITLPEDTVFDCIFIAKNSAGHACSVMYVYASKQNSSYVICTIPVSMMLDNGGRNVPLYDLIGSQSTDYAVKKLSALIGHDVTSYAVIDASGIAKIASLKADITVDIPYDAKFLNPDFSIIPESQRSEEHYITVKAGKVTLSEINAAGIFESSRDSEKTDYSFQQSMSLSILKQICSDTKFTTDLVAQKKLHSAFDTNLDYNDFSELSRLIFSYATAKQNVISYPTSKDYSSADSVVPDWDKGIGMIEEACG